jgi:seryl-tRNA synthetase
MLDIRFIRDNPDEVKLKSAQKGFEVDVDQLLSLDSERSELLQQVEELRRRRNETAEKIKQAGGKPDQELIDVGKQIKLELADREELLKKTEEEWLIILKSIPNMPVDDVPIGDTEDQNVVVKEVGDRPEFDFEPKNHAEIAIAKDWLDKERAAKVAGSRFAYLKGDLVMLDWAVNMFGLSQLTDVKVIEKLIKDNNLDLESKAFIPVQPPAVANTAAYEATGRLNKEEQTYKLADDDLWLNASAEHVLAPMYMNEIIAESDLPIRYVGYTTAFRREAGTYGQDTEGFLRMHQFNKLEMETFSNAETSFDEHFLMIAIQEYLMQQLELPYRVLNKCTADIGGPNARGVDIDVWLPGQDKYRESHSADYITDYQARRTNTRMKKSDGALEFVHTNDATAFAQRTLIGILENNQTAEGDVIIPEVLRPFMGGRTKI